MDDRARASLAQWTTSCASRTRRRARLSRTLVCGWAVEPRAGGARIELRECVPVGARQHDPSAVPRRDARAISSERCSWCAVSRDHRRDARVLSLPCRARPRGRVSCDHRSGEPARSLAHERGFRGVFRHPPMWRRYAALTVVGMLPAALLGVNGRDLSSGRSPSTRTPRAARGARLAEAASREDKLCCGRRRRWRRLAD